MLGKLLNLIPATHNVPSTGLCTLRCSSLLAMRYKKWGAIDAASNGK